MNLSAIRVKSNAKYTCQECGSTELLQAHHTIRGDDSSLVCLCGKCHSAKHPNVPANLFFTYSHQPYWINKSASSLARQWNICSRTVIRAAKRWGIESGLLNALDEELLRQKISKERVAGFHPLREAAKALSMSIPYIYLLKDLRRIKTETMYGRLVISEEELCRYKCAKEEGK